MRLIPDRPELLLRGPQCALRILSAWCLGCGRPSRTQLARRAGSQRAAGARGRQSMLMQYPNNAPRSTILKNSTLPRTATAVAIMYFKK